MCRRLAKNVLLDALVPELRLPTGKLPVTCVARLTSELQLIKIPFVVQTSPLISVPIFGLEEPVQAPPVDIQLAPLQN